MSQRVVVVGAGWAGQGYIAALRAAKADVVALCGRTPEPCQAVGRKLGIDDIRLDWRTAIEELHPDIVVVATPAGPHREIVELAAGLGCHLLCEKPLARNAPEALAMLEAVEASGVKHAYGATSRYSPALIQAKALLDDGLIGELREAESIAHFEMPALLTHSWIHRIEEGGGILMNVLPHFLGQVQYVSGGTPRWATGVADSEIDQAPVGTPLHDFRDLAPIDVEAANGIHWRDVDADMRATAIIGLETPSGVAVRGLWHVSSFTGGRNPGYLALAGGEGTIHLTGFPWHHQLEHRRVGSNEWTEVQISPSKGTTDPVQHGWDRLTAEFLMDVRGSGDPDYPTFRDGYLANQVIDQVRGVHTELLAPKV